MTLLPVLLITLYGVWLNGIENLSFLFYLTSSWSPSVISDGFAFAALSAYALVFAFTSVSLSRDSRSRWQSTCSSGSFPLIFLLNNNSAGLLSVVVWPILRYFVTYLLTSFFQSTPSAWAMRILYIKEAFIRSTSPLAWGHFWCCLEIDDSICTQYS